jgi:DNA polymerase-3 subunit epsilon
METISSQYQNYPENYIEYLEACHGNNLKFFYYHYGLNFFATTAISDLKSKYNQNEKNICKSPFIIPDFKEYYAAIRAGKSLYRFDDVIDPIYEFVTGLGVVLGYNGLHAIDIDGAFDEHLVALLLDHLNLPKDYPWVVLSGSHDGFHIIFQCLETLDQDNLAFENRSEFYYGDFRIEYRKNGHLVLPPSIHKSGKKYLFINGVPSTPVANFNSDKQVLDSLIKCFGEISNMDGSSQVKTIYDLSHEANSSPEPEKRFLFFDTETNGLPLDYNKHSSHTENWPRLVQIAWIETTENGDILEEENYVIKPIGFEIKERSTEVHGITDDFARNNGAELKDVLRIFYPKIINADLIIGHNIKFDVNVVAAEYYRLFNKNPFDNKDTWCTMLNSVDLLKLQSYHGFKWPKLSELYFFTFQTHLKNAHDAGVDITATKEVFFKLLEMGQFDLSRKG